MNFTTIKIVLLRQFLKSKKKKKISDTGDTPQAAGLTDWLDRY